MEKMDATGAFDTPWMGTLERQPLEGMELSGAFESSCLAGASGAAAADSAGDEEQVSWSGHLLHRAVYHES